MVPARWVDRPRKLGDSGPHSTALQAATGTNSTTSTLQGAVNRQSSNVAAAPPACCCCCCCRDRPRPPFFIRCPGSRLCPPQKVYLQHAHTTRSTNTEHRAGGDRITLTHTRITCISASLRGHGALHHREGSRMNEGQRAMREVFNGSSRYCHLAGPPWLLELVNTTGASVHLISNPVNKGRATNPNYRHLHSV